MTNVRTHFFIALLITTTLGCGDGQTAQFGEPCETGEDCQSDFCVGGEAAGPSHEPFCSEDCSGKSTGDPCGDGQGQCIADFTSWCWKPCETNKQCADINPARGVCGQTSSSGNPAPFQVCVAGP